MFNETISKVIMGLMVMSCFGSLLVAVHIAQVFKSSAEEISPAFFKIFSKDAPIVGMVALSLRYKTLLS